MRRNTNSAVAVIMFLMVFAFAGTGSSPGQATKPPTEQEKANESIAAQFAKADQNSDKKITLEEFLVNRPADIAKRDFILVDFNADGVLSRAEFAALPTLVAPWLRGPMPDPMLALVDSIAAALDQALGWKEKPDLQIDSDGFVAALAGKFGPVMSGLNVGDPDTDGDSRVSRAEGRRFLEMLLGVRRTDGKPLREANGRVINYMLYLYVDLNRNDKLEKAEFLERSFAGDAAQKEFDSVNADGNDFLSFEEWCQLPHRGATDPILEFRQMDKDLDAFLSAEEIVNGTPEWKRPLAEHAFPGFDLNGDGKLSLSEYRLTPQANPVLPWQTILTDVDGDDTLGLKDFRFEKGMFPLLHLIYFRRFDTNGDHKLEVSEYTFRTKTPDEFFTLNEDGTGWKSFFKFAGRPACGSPAISPDGKQIAFDAWPGGQQSGSAIYLMDINGSEPKQYCLGMMPNWSKDGTKLACSRSSPSYGAWLMDLKGEDHQNIGRGWGAQFSPDGTQVAYTEGGPIIKTWNVETAAVATIFDGKEKGYEQIFWNMTWSPDSRRICFKAVKSDGTQEVAIVDADGEAPNLKVLYTAKQHINADFAWHPAGNRIVFATMSSETKTTQLFEVDPGKNDPPVLVKGQDPKRNNTDACWTPDGKRLIVVSGDY